MNNTIKILFDLIAIKSDTHDGIKIIADYICDILEKHNIIFQRILHTENNTESIIAGININILRDINSGLVLSGHMDTVAANQEMWDTPPYAPTVFDNKIFGRGAADMKYFIAIVLGMLDKLKEFNYPIILIFTGDEESDVFGIRYVCDFMKQNNIKPKIAIVGEPTNSEIIIEHNGYCGFSTTVRGHAAHSSNLSDGINSIYIACELILYMQMLANKYIKQGTTINVGRINGGQRRNIVPDSTTFEWEIRFAKTEHQKEIIQAVKNAQRNLEQKYKNTALETQTAEHIFALLPVGNDKIADVIANITCTNKTVSKIATEAGFFANMGIDTVVFGTADTSQAHTANEHININALDKYKQILNKILNKLTQSA